MEDGPVLVFVVFETGCTVVVHTEDSFDLVILSPSDSALKLNSKTIFLCLSI